MIASLHAVNLMGGKVLLIPVVVLLSVGVLMIALTAVLRRRRIAHDATAPGLYGVTGRMGGGKSYFLTWMASIALERGLTVFCTYELKGFITFAEWQDKMAHGDDWQGAVLIEPSEYSGDGKGWDQIIQAPPHATIIVDEAHGWWPAQAWNVPIEKKMWITTLRHRKQTFFWGTQWTDAVAKWLRALSFGIWECENFKAGHRYTLYHPRKINGKIGTRTYDARIFTKRKTDVMAMYDTLNTAAHSTQWGGLDDAPSNTRTTAPQHKATAPTAAYSPDTVHRSPF